MAKRREMMHIFVGCVDVDDPRKPVCGADGYAYPYAYIQTMSMSFTEVCQRANIGGLVPEWYTCTKCLELEDMAILATTDL